MIEENTIVGNTNGIFVAAGVQGNVFRGNLILGNPGVQVSVDHATNNGLDIQNLATAGANAFEGNTCATAVNAPCPSTGPSLSATPNPIPVASGATLGQTTISWNAPDAQVIEIHLGSPSGSLFTNQGNRGSIQTGVWVKDGMTFYMQDVTGGKPLTADYTLATLVVHVAQSGSTGSLLPRFGGPPVWLAGGIAATLIALTFAGPGKTARKRRSVAVVSGGLVLLVIMFGLAVGVLAQSRPTAEQTSAALDRMTASHNSPRELAQYVFDTQGCKSCHTLGQGDKLGFTPRGQQVGGNFEGCIRLLTDVSATAKVPDNRRSEQQRHNVARFQEFGCTFCHQMKADTVGMTAVGAKLSNLHMGCVDVEKQLAAASARH